VNKILGFPPFVVHSLRMIENTMIQRIFGPKKSKYRKDGEKTNRFHNLYSSSFIVTVIKKRMKWTGACSTFE
jgi:hypothetical protein